jgi:hypothetical protein
MLQSTKSGASRTRESTYFLLWRNGFFHLILALPGMGLALSLQKLGKTNHTTFKETTNGRDFQPRLCGIWRE